MITYSPALLSTTADPEGSVRYENIQIIHEQIPSNINQTSFYNVITEHNAFIVEELGTEFLQYQAHIFKGTVLQEQSGEYSWWRNIVS